MPVGHWVNDEIYALNHDFVVKDGYADLNMSRYSKVDVHAQ